MGKDKCSTEVNLFPFALYSIFESYRFRLESRKGGDGSFSDVVSNLAPNQQGDVEHFHRAIFAGCDDEIFSDNHVTYGFFVTPIEESRQSMIDCKMKMTGSAKKNVPYQRMDKFSLYCC